MFEIAFYWLKWIVRVEHRECIGSLCHEPTKKFILNCCCCCFVLFCFVLFFVFVCFCVCVFFFCLFVCLFFECMKVAQIYAKYPYLCLTLHFFVGRHSLLPCSSSSNPVSYWVTWKPIENSSNELAKLSSLFSAFRKCLNYKIGTKMFLYVCRTLLVIFCFENNIIPPLQSTCIFRRHVGEVVNIPLKSTK